MKIAVVGCGTIAQIMHIPNVLETPETDLVALCDPGENVTATLGERYNVPRTHRYQDPDELFEKRADEIDAVIITTPMQTHADIVETALEAGVNTLVEKPLAVTPDDADRLVEAADNSDATAMVAYNRRFELAYDRLLEEMSDVEQVDSVTAYAVDADFSKSLPDIYDIVRPDLSEEFIEESNARRHEQCVEAVGSDVEEMASAYDFQLEHICHDVNALRGLFGEVKSVDHVDFIRDGFFGTVHLTYEDDERVLVQSGDSERHFHEQFLRIDSPDRVLTLEFDHPFIRYNSASLSIRSGTTETADCQYDPTREESFKRELEHFVSCVQDDETVRTPFADARDDIELIASLFEEYDR